MNKFDAIRLGGISAAVLIVSRVQQRKRKYRKSTWMKDFLKNRNFAILKELELNEDILFKNFTRMTKSNFYKLLQIIEPEITKIDTFFRQAVPAETRLAITLRFLATGDSFMSLFYLFKVSKQLISAMLPEVLQAIIKALANYIKVRIIYLAFCVQFKVINSCSSSCNSSSCDSSVISSKNSWKLGVPTVGICELEFSISTISNLNSRLFISCLATA